MGKSRRFRVIVVGGGAGGLMAALTAARCGAKVTILEMANRVGKKLLRTGNGRCNMTNLYISPEGYNCPDFVAPVLSETSPEELLAQFGELGLWTAADSEGRVYPRSDTAASVLDVLRLGCTENGAEEICSSEIHMILPQPDGTFLLRTREGSEYRADRVIVATGGGIAPVKNLGHRVTALSPILCPLRTETGPIRGLSGLRARAGVTLYRGEESVFVEQGEVLFRDYGVSGIVILNASRYAEPGMRLEMDLLPECTQDELAEKLAARPRRGGELLTGLFHRRVGEALLRQAPGGDPVELAQVIKHFSLLVQDKADAQNAQVTRGGVDVSQVEPSTLESHICPGLYVIGEALNVDGRCGGFNLHWAFASGIAAGRSAALD